jgi:hypothetical protein
MGLPRCAGAPSCADRAEAEASYGASNVQQQQQHCRASHQRCAPTSDETSDETRWSKGDAAPSWPGQGAIIRRQALPLCFAFHMGRRPSPPRRSCGSGRPPGRAERAACAASHWPPAPCGALGAVRLAQLALVAAGVPPQSALRATLKPGTLKARRLGHRFFCHGEAITQGLSNGPDRDTEAHGRCDRDRGRAVRRETQV